jgi:hypothetical protein
MRIQQRIECGSGSENTGCRIVTVCCRLPAPGPRVGAALRVHHDDVRGPRRLLITQHHDRYVHQGTVLYKYDDVWGPRQLVITQHHDRYVHQGTAPYKYDDVWGPRQLVITQHHDRYVH